MDIEEIKKYIGTGRDKAICIDCSHAPEYPGLIREIWIKPDSRIQFSYLSYGYNDGGLDIYITYESLDKIVQDLEEYLSQGMAEWKNFSKNGEYPPPLNQEIDTSDSWGLIENDLKFGKIRLPAKGCQYEIPSIYWAKIAGWKTK